MFEFLGRQVYVVGPGTGAEELLAVGKGLLGSAKDRLAEEAEQQDVAAATIDIEITRSVEEYEAFLARLQEQHEANVGLLEARAVGACATRDRLQKKAQSVGKAVDLL